MLEVSLTLLAANFMTGHMTSLRRSEGAEAAVQTGHGPAHTPPSSSHGAHANAAGVFGFRTHEDA